MARRAYKVNGGVFLSLSDAALDFKSPSSSPEITVHLSQLFITAEGLSLFLLEGYK